MEESPVQVGAFVFDPATGELTRSGVVTRLRPQAARALSGLVRRPGELVTRDELSSWIWPSGRIDSDLGLNVCIRQVRAALDDDAANPSYIETLRARGYRLVAEVTPIPRETSTDSRSWRRGPIVAVLVVVFVAVLLFRTGAAEEPPAVRLAATPFLALSDSDTADYLRAALLKTSSRPSPATIRPNLP